jgi:hypothetical protein
MAASRSPRFVKSEKNEKEKISNQQRAILEKYGALNESSDSD